MYPEDKLQKQASAAMMLRDRGCKQAVPASALESHTSLLQNAPRFISKTCVAELGVPVVLWILTNLTAL